MMRVLILVFGGLLLAQPALAEAPARLITIGGAVTETVFALGAGDQVVGIDQTSTYPAKAISALPQVGYARALAAEGLLSLRADLLIAGPEAGPETSLQQVEAAGLHVLRLEPGFTPESAMQRILAIGTALSRLAEAEKLTGQIEHKLARIEMEIARQSSHPKVLFLLQAGRGAPMAAGRNTAADAMIALAGGENVAKAFSGYKPLSPEAMLQAAPDILLMMQPSITAMGGEAAVLSLPEIAKTPAALNRRLIAIDGNYMLGFGPRLADAVAELAYAFHPGMSFTGATPSHGPAQP